MALKLKNVPWGILELHTKFHSCIIKEHNHNIKFLHIAAALKHYCVIIVLHAWSHVRTLDVTLQNLN